MTCRCALEGGPLCTETLLQKQNEAVAKAKMSPRSQLRQEDCYKLRGSLGPGSCPEGEKAQS